MDVFVFVLFLSALFVTSLRGCRKVESEGTYLVANRRMSLLGLTATLVMTEFNTATLLSFSSMGYVAGAWALWLPVVFFVGLMFYALAVSAKWKAFNGVSVSSYFTIRYGKDIGILASLALLTAMAGFSAAYVKSLYILFTPFFPSINPWALSGLLVVAVLILMLRGGLLSIVRADVLSFAVVLLFFPLMAIFAGTGGSEAPIVMERGSQILPFRFILSLIILTMFTYILAPWYGQKIFAARSKKTAFLAVGFASVIVFALYGLAVFTTWRFRISGGIAPSAEQALPFAIAHLLPIGLRGLGYGILFAASATTLTGVWSAMSAMLVSDFGVFAEAKSYKRSMLWTVVCALTSFLLANLVVDAVFDKLILANIPIAALSFALLGGFYWKGTSRAGVYASLLVGWGCGVGSYLLFGTEGGYTWYWAAGGIPATFASGILISILVPDRKKISLY